MNTIATTTETTKNSGNTNGNIAEIQPAPKPQTSKEVIAANVKLLIAQLGAGHSEGLTAYLAAMGRFRNYSLGNILEIARQCPTATHVTGMYAWNQLIRRVKKGSKGIRILAPMFDVRRKQDKEADKDITKQNRPVLVGFRSTYIFDVAMTDGAPLPELTGKFTGDARIAADFASLRFAGEGTETFPSAHGPNARIARADSAIQAKVRSHHHPGWSSSLDALRGAGR